MPDSESSSHKDVIEAVEVRVLSQQNKPTTATDARRLHTAAWIWLGFVILLVLALYVIFFLPQTIDLEQPNKSTKKNVPTESVLEQKNTDEISLSKPVEPIEPVASPPKLEDAAQQQAKAQAEKLLTRIIELESILENHAIKKWAVEEYAHASEQGRIGDEYFRRKQFQQATTSFQTAIDQLQDLQHRIQPTLEQALSRGEQALTQGDRFTALQQFELASAIAPTNIQAKNGLQRAQTIEQLFALLQRGSSFESHGQLQQAKITYEEAVKLDPLSEQAKSALQRVNTKLIQREFDQLIASGYRALQNGQYSDARAAFNAAKDILPKSKEATTGLNKVAVAVRNEKIQNLIFEAEHFEQLEQWQQAATSYEKIIQLDRSHDIAKRKLAENINKAEILIQLQKSLEAAQQLHQKNVLAQAEEVLAAVAKLNSPGAMIAQRGKELGELVRVATTPIQIILESDNHTEVTVYKVARLGTFSRTELQLRPGPYTIVGTRTGYRDVRKTIQVTPESKNIVLSILCDEPI